MKRVHRKSALWATAAVAAIVIVVAAVGVVGSGTQACSACHATAAEGLSASSHETLGCYDCHASGVGAIVTHKVREFLVMYPRWTLGGSDRTGPTARIADSACLSCHSEVMESAEPQVSRGLRISHADCVDDSSCDSCHQAVGHGPSARFPLSASMGRCVECHTDLGAAIECETCHTEGYERDDLLVGPFRVTHGSNWERTHGMGDLPQCLLCHQQEDCARCHGPGVPHTAGFGATHGQVSLSPESACDSCHASTFCADCHQIDMPHPAGFLPEHSSLVSSTNDPACVRCHTQEDCDRCHQRHIHPGGAATAPGVSEGSGGEAQ